VRRFIENSGLLVAGAAAALLWANLSYESYERFSDALHFLVNDVAMVFFFALATKEVVEATAPGGALHSPRRALVPMLAAIGGMAGPAAIYVALALLADVPELLRGWAIPSATDIAFSYLVARFTLGPTHPGIPFLLLLAIADDALGLMILAAFYPTGSVRPVEFVVLLAAAMLIARWLRWGRTRNFWPYVAGAGIVSWVAFYRGGLHPALALVPIVPFLPHAKRDPGLFVESPHAHDPLNEFEHWWRLPVHLILFFFGLVNAGVPVSGTGPGTWIVLAAILPILLGTTVAGTAYQLEMHLPPERSPLLWKTLFLPTGAIAAYGLAVPNWVVAGAGIAVLLALTGVFLARPRAPSGDNAVVEELERQMKRCC